MGRMLLFRSLLGAVQEVFSDIWSRTWMLRVLSLFRLSGFMHYLFLQAVALPFYFEQFKKNSSRNVACPLVLLFLLKAIPVCTMTDQNDYQKRDTSFCLSCQLF